MTGPVKKIARFRPLAACFAGAALAAGVWGFSSAKSRDSALLEGDQPAVSPDGKTLAFRSWKGGQPEIFLVALERTDKGRGLAGAPRNWTNNSALDGSPTWSPDGKRICFVSTRAGSRDLWVADVDHPEAAERITLTDGPEEDPAWSPDGRRIVYVGRDGGRTDLFTVPAAGGEPVRVTNSDDDETRPCWSPDGGRVAFSADREDGFNIWMVDFGRAAERPGAVMDRSSSGAPFGIYRLTEGLFEDRDPSWVPGTELISFSSNRRTDISGGSVTTRSGRDAVREIRPDEPRRIFQISSGPRPILTQLIDTTQAAESPAWDSNGHDLFYVLSPRASEREGGDSTKATIHLREAARGGK